MKVKNHPGYHLLTNLDFKFEVMKSIFPEDEFRVGMVFRPEHYALMMELSPENNTTYLVTETVVKKIDSLKIKTHKVPGEPDRYDWTVFEAIGACKKTFLLPNGMTMRVNMREDKMGLMVFGNAKPGTEGLPASWIFYWIDRATGKRVAKTVEDEVLDPIDESIYKILCFLFLAENEEVLVAPGGRHGTQKSGKVLNETPFPVIILNNNWNVTSIRTDGFPVAGHMAIRWVGPGRGKPKMVFIQPFEKHGYIRRARNKDA